ncbi:SAM-dependent methyltransferase [Ferrimonas balearica]|uniref:SAM-dependent methyltransferase n=1 Tax=Ferrimonas balearica TaxID=44012 RepID=UPI001C98F869|nr:cyclopropane-fatty-acyl-phospholipid synthase family protein [Ferrimonas balearica]MBY5992588.1 cyclopropane-fatty-acyl-phospholipid synthase family protein [Ferrimonas balearica]
MTTRVSTAPRWDLALCRRTLMALLPRLERGTLCLEEGGQQWQFGQGAPRVKLVIHHPKAWRRLLFGGAIALAELYRDGDVECDDLTALLTLFADNLAWLDRLERRYGFLLSPWHRLQHLRRHNSKANARKNIAAHYDLSNDFYRLFLDEGMVYSSALWQEADTLEQAQANKIARLCEQLDLKPEDHLLEIGTGWGALAIHAARKYGCRVTTTTISEAQYQEARTRIDAAGLGHRIKLLRLDYRDLSGQYDKIVSVEMIEAVGERYLAGYFQTLNRLLKPGGLMALQAITIADQRYDSYRRGADFIQTYIFPGGFLPSVKVMGDLIAGQTDMVIRDLTDIGLDYARTLVSWRDKFEAALPQVQSLGFDDPFVRLWRFYFCYCQAGFETRRVSTVQLTAQKSR